MFACRVLWVVLVVSSMIFFMVEVGIRSRDYLKYETNIDIEISFEEQLPFPALTVCNQNAFRMTKAVELELNDFLREIYTVPDISGKE